MKTCIIYSITIYLVFMMLLILQKPSFICDDNGNFKSWEYLKEKVLYGFQDSSELICLPTIAALGSVLSFFIARNIIDK